MRKTSLNVNDVWEKLGSLEQDQPDHVLSRLFVIYEQILAAEPSNKEALRFMQNLENAINFCVECNLNRR